MMFLKLLSKKLELGEVKSIPLPIHPGDIYEVPYNEEGYLDTNVRMVWDLRVGTAVIIYIKEAKNYGALGTVGSKRGEHYSIFLEELKKNTVLRLLGVWWVDAALRGTVLRIPLINVNPKVVPFKKD